MKKLSALLLILSLIPSLAFAEGEVIDPGVTPSKTLACVYPTEYTDNTQIQPGDIESISLYTSQTKSINDADWAHAYTSTSGCSATLNTTLIPDGQYYYTFTAKARGLDSEKAYIFDQTQFIAIVIQRPIVIVPPKPPTMLMDATDTTAPSSTTSYGGQPTD